MRLITQYLPDSYIAALDLLVNEGCLPKAKVSEESAEGLSLAMRTDERREMEH